MLRALTPWLFPALLSASILNDAVVDPNLFRVTRFASNLGPVNSVLAQPGNALIAVVSPGFGTAQVVLFQDADHNGIADGAPTILYSNALAGPGVQIRQSGDLFYLGEFGLHSITALAPGATLTAVDRLLFNYPPGHLHPTPGFVTRPTPGTPGSIDLVFNVGSQNNDSLSADPVQISGFGLPPTDLEADSLYMITISEAGGVPVASNLRQVATGIRNVYGLAFHPATGDLYFSDNAIDEGTVTQTSEPPQADELNRILAADLGVNLIRFGYPDCYREYRTNNLIENTPGACADVTESLANFHPSAGNERAEGPTEIAFSPNFFPSAFQNGIFAGFSGGQGPGGINNQNGVVFVDSTYSQLLRFVAPATPGLGSVLGVYATEDSLFLSDWFGGSIYQITAESIPEPSTWAFVALGCVLIHARSRFRS